MKNIDPIVKGLGLTQHAWNKQGKHTWLPPSCSERRYATIYKCIRCEAEQMIDDAMITIEK